MTPPTLSTSFDSVQEDWTGLSDQRQRRALQNRINQRKHRTRMLRARLALLMPERRASATLRNPIESNRIGYANPAWSPLAYTGLSAFEWNILLYAKDTLWQKPRDPSLSSHADQYAATQQPIGLACWHIPENAILRHSILLATAIDLESLSGQDYTALKLRHANATIEHVRRGIEACQRQNADADTNTNSTASMGLMDREALLFALMALAKQSRSTSLTPLPETFGLFHPPFPLGFQFLNLWGQDDGHPVHHRALQSLVRSRDDLERMQFCTPGFGDVVAQFDLMESAKTLSAPCIAAWPANFDLVRDDVFSSGGAPEPQGHFPTFLRRGSNLGTLLAILADVRFYCLWCRELQHRLEMDPTAVERQPWLSLGGLVLLRDSIEHRLLSYKVVDHSVEEQLCLTATLIFVHCVVYPLPNRKPLDTLLGRLQSLIRRLDTAGQGQEDIVFGTWMATVAAMACHVADETRTRFFLEMLRTCVDGLGISSWAQMRSLLTGFFWLDRACDPGGLEIWHRLVALP